MVLYKYHRLLNNKSLIFLYSGRYNKNGNKFFNRFNSTEPKEHLTEIRLSNGRKMKLAAGKYAQFTNGSVIAESGDTAVLCTVVNQNVFSNSSIVPLTVNYRQKAAAAGRIPTNFFRRELGFTEQEILMSRLIDRSVRPLFAKEYSYETQIVCNLLATDGMNDPDVLSINAASAVLTISDIPWNGPVGAVKVGVVDNNFIINPTRRELQNSILNLIVTCTSHNLIVMLEGSGNDILEQDLRKAIRFAVKDCQTIIQSIKNLQQCAGKCKANMPNTIRTETYITDSVRNFLKQKLKNIFTCYTHDKISRDNALMDLKAKMLESITDSDPEVVKVASDAFEKLKKNVFRSLIFETDKRCDGREMNQLRDINCQVGLFEPLHGSAFFQRGQTQVLCTVTLDCIENALKTDTVTMLTSGIKEKNFFLHYEFPPYATKETGRVTGFNRREIGHGSLAEKGLKCVIPQNYPFAIRLTSEVLQSNGSSSMATVCGGSLALMDAGIPISSPVAGVAMGLITKLNDKNLIEDYRILTDLLGIEDYLGDMDFKISGTKRGFTAFQADVKLPGVPLKVMMEAISQATTAKNKIINIMNTTLAATKNKNKNNQPKLETIEIPVHLRSKFLGAGGSNLKKIFSETGVTIYLQEDNMYSIFAPNEVAMTEAKKMITQLLKKDAEPTLIFGDIYTAKIIEIRDSGVMVSLYPNMVPTLLPTSQLDQRKIHHPSVLGLEIGQEIEVKYFGRDPVNGQIRLSRKVLQDPVSNIRNLMAADENSAD